MYFSPHSYWCTPTRHIIWSIVAKVSEMKAEGRNAISCALERYNRAVNELFPNRRPNLLQFETGILEEAKKRTPFLVDKTIPTIAKKNYPTASVKLIPNSCFKYLCKDNKTVSPKRPFNKKRNATHKKMAFGRMVKGFDSDLD